MDGAWPPEHKGPGGHQSQTREEPIQVPTARVHLTLNLGQDPLWLSEGSSEDAVREPVRDSVRGPVRGASKGPVRGPVRDSIRDSLRDPVSGTVRSTVRSAVRDSVRGPVDGGGGAMRSPVGGGSEGLEPCMCGEITKVPFIPCTSLRRFSNICDLSKSLKDYLCQSRKCSCRASEGGPWPSWPLCHPSCLSSCARLTDERPEGLTKTSPSALATLGWPPSYRGRPRAGLGD